LLLFSSLIALTLFLHSRHNRHHNIQGEAKADIHTTPCESRSGPIRTLYGQVWMLCYAITTKHFVVLLLLMLRPYLILLIPSTLLLFLPNLPTPLRPSFYLNPPRPPCEPQCRMPLPASSSVAQDHTLLRQLP
jgi:hypothetical protein